jgi:ribokinase
MRNDGAVAVLGSLNMDIVIRTEHLPRPGETLAALDVTRHPGGKGANQAAAAARAGASTAMIGAVGDDAFGGALLTTLAALGVDIAGVPRLQGAQTGTAYVTVETGGENQIIVHGGANLAVTPAMATGLADGPVRLAQLETPLETVAAFLAGKTGRRILNAAPYLEGARALFPQVDLLIVNETELADYAGVSRRIDSPRAAEALARTLLCRPGQTIVVTMGAKGLVAVSAQETLVLAGRSAKVVDTTGAGDCFCGVLAAALADGAPLRLALERANAAASISVSRSGAISSMPDAGEIAAALAGDRHSA